MTDTKEKTTLKRWVQIPNPGQFRGEGNWTELTSEKAYIMGFGDEDTAWEYFQETKYLPTQLAAENPQQGEL